MSNSTCQDCPQEPAESQLSWFVCRVTPQQRQSWTRRQPARSWKLDTVTGTALPATETRRAPASLPITLLLASPGAALSMQACQKTRQDLSDMTPHTLGRPLQLMVQGIAQDAQVTFGSKLFVISSSISTQWHHGADLQHVSNYMMSLGQFCRPVQCLSALLIPPERCLCQVCTLKRPCCCPHCIHMQVTFSGQLPGGGQGNAFHTLPNALQPHGTASCDEANLQPSSSKARQVYNSATLHINPEYSVSTSLPS